MGKHSTLVGGSGASRYINCVGSTDIIKRAPPPETSEFAHLGTMLHFLTEDTLGNENPDFDPHEYIGDVIELDEYDKDGEPVAIEVTEQHIVYKVLPAVQWFDEVLNPEQFWLEQEVAFTGELQGAFGTADVLFIDGDKAGIVDWKFGDGVIVSAEDNAQLKFYLAAALYLPWFYEATKGINEFHGYIVQPVEGAEEIATHTTYTRDELLDFTTSLIEAKQKKEAGDTTLTCGDWCRFCPAEIICPAWRDRGKQALETMQAGADTLPEETYKSGAKKGQLKQPSMPKVTGATLDPMTHTELRETFLEVKRLSAWCDAVTKYVKGEFDRGEPVDGLKRVVYQNERHWVDEKKAANWARRQGLKAGDYNEPATLKSPAKIEKIVGKGKLKDDLVHLAPSGFSIVAMDDPRPAYEDANDPANVSNQLAKSIGQNT